MRKLSVVLQETSNVLRPQADKITFPLGGSKTFIILKLPSNREVTRRNAISSIYNSDRAPILSSKKRSPTPESGFETKVVEMKCEFFNQYQYEDLNAQTL